MPTAFCCAGGVTLVATRVPMGSGMAVSVVPEMVDWVTLITALPVAWLESRKTGRATTVIRA